MSFPRTHPRSRALGRAVVAVMAVALIVGSLAPAGAQSYDSKNSDKVDRKHATAYTTTASRRRNKLVAANKAGYLPNNIIKLAPDSAKLGGKTLAQVIASATDTYGAGPGLALDADIFSIAEPFRLPQSCAAGQVVVRAPDGSGATWACLTLPEGTGYTADEVGIHLAGTTFSLKQLGVTTAELADLAVTTPKLANISVSEDKLQYGAVTSDKIGGGAVTTGKLAEWAVTTAKIEDAAITTAKLGYGVVTSDKLAFGAVTSSTIENGAVLGGKLANGGVTTDKVADFAIGTSKLDYDAVTSIKIADGAITTDDLAFDPVVGYELANHSASGDHDGRYYTKGELTYTGMGINTPGNPLNWHKLIGVPEDIADGVDNGPAELNAFKTDLAAYDGPPNDASDLVSWSKLRNVPWDIADGDSNTTYSAGPGITLNGTEFGAYFGGNGSLSAVAHSDHDHDATYWRLGGNTGVNVNQFIGTLDQAPLILKVNGVRVARYQGGASAATPPNVIVGHYLNDVTTGVIGATIAGGGEWSTPNVVLDDFAAIGGGTNNVAGNGTGTLTDAAYATIAGGIGNDVLGLYATVGGGYYNQAAGLGATVPGGNSNAADGSTSFAAGNRAKAIHSGSFVWGDSTGADVFSTGNDSFTARAVGGTTFYTNAAMTTGVSLTPGSGSWASVSDIALKENYTPVDGIATLEALSSMPIGTWRYLDEDASILHMGPSAQDFRAAFGLGVDDETITTVDADGVALSAIQGLYELTRQENAELSARVERLERALLGSAMR